MNPIEKFSFTNTCFCWREGQTGFYYAMMEYVFGIARFLREKDIE